MTKIYIASDNIISSLGFTTKENLECIENGVSGIKLVDDPNLAPAPFYASLVDTKQLNQRFALIGNAEEFSRFEKMAILSVNDATNMIDIDLKSPRTLFVLSTTKGNIDLLKTDSLKDKFDKRLFLWEAAKGISGFFKNPNTPVVISNACISGVAALIVGSRLIRSGLYENVVVIGADILSEFVVSGFQSFQSLSNGPCRPYDKSRDGLSLGEGCGTIVLTANQEKAIHSNILVGGGFTSNDANHISGPSRTGEGLLLAMLKTLNDPLSSHASRVDYISAHGTATPYNDEMEAIAIARAGLLDVPVNSLKGYWGHTLGAAGVIESVVAVHSMLKNTLFKTAGFSELGVSEKINVISQNINQPVNACLKTASGFGGSNSAILFYKEKWNS